MTEFNRIPRLILSFTAIIMLVCLWTTGALAYNASFPNTAKWTTLTQTFSVANEPSFIGTSATSATMTAIKNAAASWTNLPACNFTYTSPVSGVYVTNTYLDTVSNTSNNIVFLDFSTNASFITRTAALGYSNLTDTAAWTNIRTNPNDQTQIQEADIYVNTYLPIQADPSPVTGKWDLKTVMLNQFGTALGLNRITQTAQGALSQPTYKITKTFFPVMQLTLTKSGPESYPLTTGLTAVQRTYLSKDDKQGAAALYPKTPSTLTGTAVNTAGKVITSDLDNDGLDDIVYIDTLGYCYYTVDLKNWTRIGTNKFSQIVNADLNADGDEDDLAGINLNQYIIYSTDMSSWAKSGENKFSQVVAFDQDDNGVRDDLAGVNLNSYIVYTTNIAATAWSKSGNNKFSSFVAFDQDGSSANGKDDLVGVNLNQYAVYATDITGEWTKSGQNKFSSLISADIDVDGDFDDLVGVNLNQYAVYSTSITATDWSKSGSNKFQQLIALDLDSDSNLDDLAGINLNSYIVYTVSITADWTRQGTNKFTSFVAADLDGEGYNNDMVAVNLNNHVLYAMKNRLTTQTTWTGNAAGEIFINWVRIDKPQ